VARVAQVNPSLLSQIERGAASPSLVSLMAIADALAVRPGDLLDDDRVRPQSWVVRRVERRVIDDGLCRREYLMHLDDPRIEIADLMLAPGGSSRPTLAKHSGHDHGIVLEGSAVVEFAASRKVLGVGDHIAFPGTEPHRLVNVSRASRRVLWIVLLESDGPTREAARI
jgi:transcriptional regulator with XRE-family HTH domain